MSLVESFIDFAERTYSIDWAAIQQAVAARLGLTSSFDRSVYDPERYPVYWCVPLLVGSYLGASKRTVLADTEAFVSGCIMRHCMFEPDRPFDASKGGEDCCTIMNAYDGCRIGRAPASSLDARLTAKCLPWKVLLTIGTRAISGEAGERAGYATTMEAIVLVYSCLQVVDDWHDKEEDIARSHWNMWVHEPVRDCVAVIEPLLRGSRASVDRLRPHLLRRALEAQLQDAAEELRPVVNSAVRARDEELRVPSGAPRHLV